MNPCPLFFRHSGSGVLFSSSLLFPAFILIVSGLRASPRVENKRARGQPKRLATLASSIATVQKSVSRVSIARNDAIESSISTRSTILFRNGDSLGAREETYDRTRTCVGLGRTLQDAGTPLFLDARFCVSRSR